VSTRCHHKGTPPSSWSRIQAGGRDSSHQVGDHHVCLYVCLAACLLASPSPRLLFSPSPRLPFPIPSFLFLSLSLSLLRTPTTQSQIHAPPCAQRGNPRAAVWASPSVPSPAESCLGPLGTSFSFHSPSRGTSAPSVSGGCTPNLYRPFICARCPLSPLQGVFDLCLKKIPFSALWCGKFSGRAPSEACGGRLHLPVGVSVERQENQGRLRICSCL
jgi:hypothetical protein